MVQRWGQAQEASLSTNRWSENPGAGQEYLRKNNFALRVHDTYDDIVDACCNAWNGLIAVPAILASITQRAWAVAS